MAQEHTNPREVSGRPRRLPAACALAVFALPLFSSPDISAQLASAKPKQTLQDTGLYANFDTLRVDANHLTFAPQYPLWTDGAIKRRWISLPPGTTIDGSDPDAWKFPVGTRLWKEFSFNGQRVETRYMELQPNNQWLYAAYSWSADGRSTQLVSERGRPNAYPITTGRSHSIPSVIDCKVCHQGGRSEVLGFSALQLSPERDPGALHRDLQNRSIVDLRSLVDNGLLIGLPKPLVETPPRIQASSPRERAVLGYMHGNCGHCHNDQGPLQNLGLFLRHAVDAKLAPGIASTVGHSIKKRAPGQSPETALRIEPGHPDRSGLIERVASRYPALQMPPLGTELVDDEAVALLRQWVSELNRTQLTQQKEDQ